MKNIRTLADERIQKIEKRKPGTPFYCITWVYIIFVVAGTVIDWYTLHTLYDAVLNTAQEIAAITSIGVVLVIDIYACWLPAVLDHMSQKKRNIIFGIALAAIIVLIAALSVAFRISTGDVSTSETLVGLSSSSQNMLNIILGCVPVASTIALLYLSIQKNHWDKVNKAYVDEQLLIPIRVQEKELEMSLGETIDLEKLDHEQYSATVELIKAHAIKAKVEARNKFATALGDRESAKALAEPMLPDYIIESLKPNPIVESTDASDDVSNEEE